MFYLYCASHLIPALVWPTYRPKTRREAILAMRIAKRWIASHAGPNSQHPLGRNRQEELLADAIYLWWSTEWHVGRDVIDPLRATLFSVLRYLEKARWTLSEDKPHRTNEIDSPTAYSGTGASSRLHSPARLVAAAEMVERTRRLMAVSARARENRSRVRVNSGKTPPRQFDRWIQPDSSVSDYHVYSINSDGTRTPIACKLETVTVTRYQFEPNQLIKNVYGRLVVKNYTQTVPNRQQLTTRLSVPGHMPNIGKLDYGPLCYALTGADHDKRERLPTFTKKHQPEPPRPLPRTENETTPTSSPTRWNQTHTRPERSLIGPAELAAYVAAHGELPSRN